MKTKQFTFIFTEGTHPSFDGSPDMPAMLYDELRKTVTDFYKSTTH